MAVAWQIAVGRLITITALSAIIIGCGGSVNINPSAANTGGSAASSPPATPSSNTVQLSWDAPTTNADGTPLTDLAGYKIYYGTSSGSYSNAIDVGYTTSYYITNLAAGNYYIAITAYDMSFNESSYSIEVMKII